MLLGNAVAHLAGFPPANLGWRSSILPFWRTRRRALFSGTAPLLALGASSPWSFCPRSELCIIALPRFSLIPFPYLVHLRFCHVLVVRFYLRNLAGVPSSTVCGGTSSIPAGASHAPLTHAPALLAAGAPAASWLPMAPDLRILFRFLVYRSAESVLRFSLMPLLPFCVVRFLLMLQLGSFLLPPLYFSLVFLPRRCEAMPLTRL
jgi:hypothetical protein